VDEVSFDMPGARGVRVDLSDGTATGLLGDDLLAGFERVVGSRQDDDLRGDDGANELDGGRGDDELHGLDGDDWLWGGPDDDLADGGAGSDTCDAEQQVGCEPQP
jgi:Ca2+-binding RTX toxin-like protein